MVLADYLGVPVYSVSKLRDFGFAPEDVKNLVSDSTGFSALTVVHGIRHSILYNNFHSPARTVASVTHELSHILLRHEPHPAFGIGGSRVWKDEIEEEATWHSGSLLVPRDGAIVLLRRGLSFREAALHLGVSQQLFTWRANTTGVMKVLSLAKAG
jgi:Zn-dependent peptidase ImmA (M78 family)